MIFFYFTLTCICWSVIIYALRKYMKEIKEKNK